MNVNYDGTELINEVRLDIQEFGKQLQVYAVYSLFPETDRVFITDYVHAKKPDRDEYMTDDEYINLIEQYKKQLDTLKETKHELMTLGELLDKLKKQNKLI